MVSYAKCIVVGNSGSGKTSFLKSFGLPKIGEKEPWEKYVPTALCETAGCNLLGNKHNFNLLEISPRMSFKGFELFAKNAKCAVIVDDGTRKSTKDKWSLRKWKDMMSHFFKIPFVVVRICRPDEVISTGDVSQDGIISVDVRRRVNTFVPMLILSQMLFRGE